MQQGLINLSRWLESLCKFIAGISLLGLLLVTIGDVSVRYLYRLTGGALSWSVVGSVELVSYLLLFSLLAAMAANVEKSQVVVEAFSHGLSSALKARIAGFYLLGFAALGVVLCIGLWDSAISANAHGEVTQDLRLPMGPIYQVAAVLSLLLCIRSLIHALLSTLFKHQGEETQHG